LTKRFGPIKAVDDLSFEVRNGEYVCILGSTGSGKTTLLRLISGIIKPTEGVVEFQRRRMNDVPAEERNAVYVPQTYALFPHLTVLENVSYGPLSKNVPRSEAEETAMRVLRMVKLDKRADSYPNELSGGMQQRVALARGLASGSETLLLDEPLGALDARLRLELRGELRKLAKDSELTVIHVTHDQEEAMAIGDRILVLRHGKLQQHSTPFHVYNRPLNIFVANFVGNTNFLEGIVERRDLLGSVVRLREGLRIKVADVSFETNEPIVVAFREEKLMISPDPHPEEMENKLSGEVVERHFLGEWVRYSVRLVNGDIVSSRVPAGSPIEVRKGSWVSLAFDPVNTYIYESPAIGLQSELEVY
jgi:ABC-type Fe3+/spermidine/putrescine transport system ATPase subunit